MKRKLIHKLLDWKESSQKKPILLTGGRGVGKSYFVHDFARAFYTESIYINFEREPYFSNLIFENTELTIDDWIMNRFRISDSIGPILIILDEISFCNRIPELLTMFSRGKLEYHIIAISSNLHSDYCHSEQMNNSLFIQMELYPLDFEEFLIATGNEWYIAVIKEHFNTNTKIPDIVHDELLGLFQLYIQVGGMPLAVNEYINTDGMYNISDMHQLLINSYLTEVNGRNLDGEALKINQVFSTIDQQLLKENRKFQYTLIRKGATWAMYAEALQYLKNTYYGLFCYKLDDEILNQISKIESNLNNDTLISLNDSEESKLSYKLYMLDVGLLYSTFKPQRVKMTDDSIEPGIIENYVAQTLVAKGYPLYFWESNSQAKIDFIIKKEGKVVPIEVKCNKNTRSKNVSVFRTKCDHVNDSIKISTRNFDYSNQVKYVPVYAVFCI